MKFIDLLDLDFNNSKKAYLNCSFGESGAKGEQNIESIPSDVFLLDNGLLIGSTKTLDNKGIPPQLILGYYTPEVLYFHALTLSYYGYKFLAVRDKDTAFKGRFRDESLFSGQSFGLCDITLDNVHNLEEQQSVQSIKDLIKVYARNVFADRIFEQIEELYDPREILSLMTKAGILYKTNPANICLDEPAMCK